ncbi:aminotransferase class V-fold PLP-dependent enzyme [Sphingobium sp. AN641]|uniref:cysteine desulfurase family protein n=1 Tax=Sphingobium sp. AN641 TaxID=3133443 RepID=UPI0030BF9C57
MSETIRVSLSDRLYLDHAATMPMLASAKAAMVDALDRWANPSSPHADGRAARAALEDARSRIGRALGWDGHVLFTSGASEAIAIGIGRAKAARIMTSPVEHDAVLRVTKDRDRLRVDDRGMAHSGGATAISGADSLFAVQHVNNETGVIQPLDDFPRNDALLFADCAQSAGKLALPHADMIAISAHKCGGPPGVGALLLRDLALIEPTGGQEQGYRAGTENLPAILGFAAALDAPRDWLEEAARLRARLDAAIEAAGGQVVARDAPRIPTIASYAMPGVSARSQLIQFDLAGISVSAGSACSSGSLKPSHVLKAMGWDDEGAAQVIRVSFGPTTSAVDIDRFLAVWTAMVERARQ